MPNHFLSGKQIISIHIQSTLNSPSKIKIGRKTAAGSDIRGIRFSWVPMSSVRNPPYFLSFRHARVNCICLWGNFPPNIQLEIYKHKIIWSSKFKIGWKLPERSFKKIAPAIVRGLTVELTTLLNEGKHSNSKHNIFHHSKSQFKLPENMNKNDSYNVISHS